MVSFPGGRDSEPSINIYPHRRPRRGYTKRQLIAWLDEQERIVREPGVPNEIVAEFDPLHNPPLRQQLHEVYDRGDRVIEQGRRTILFRFRRNLENSIAVAIQRKLVEHVKTRFKLKLSSVVELRNIVDDDRLSYYEIIGDSPWLETLTSAENWVKQQEELRLENQHRPNTQWVYEKTSMVYVKVILDRQPLAIGQGCLPDWLRNKRDVIPLDIFNDKLCLFRCIAVHRGAHVRRNIRRTRELAETFFAKRPGLRNRLTARHVPLLEEHFKQGIAVYEVQPNGAFHLTHLPANYDRVGQPVLTMGLYNGHAFLIRDIKKVTRDFTCGDCQARFTKPCDLVRHATSHCSLGQTKTIHPNKRISASASAYENSFYPEDCCSFIGTKWLEWEAQQRGIHIHLARCGHGGERHFLGARVDGYHPETKTIFQFHGCFWHGCKQCYPKERKGFVQQKTKQGNVITRRDTQGQPMRRKDAYGLTLQRTQFLRDSGYTVVEKWEHEKPTPWATTRCPERKTETYPHVIVYDFESYQDKSKAFRPTRDLAFESEHVPISVSIADTLNPEPEYIVSKDPGELIHLFYQSLERRHEAIRADVVDKFGLPDIDGITESQGEKILQWFNQVPVLGFNSGHYDLKLIRKYFVPLMAQDRGVYAAEKNGRIMFINTPKFKFLDVMNYLAPGITYDKWVKTYGATLAKSWLPYEWFDSADKLDYLGLPPTWLGILSSRVGTFYPPRSTKAASASSKSVACEPSATG